MVASGKPALYAKQAVIQQALREGKGYKEIAVEYRVSFRDIARVAKEMGSPAPFDVFDMVVEGFTPREIAEETGAGFDEVKKLYQHSVEMLELVARQNKALDSLGDTELYTRLQKIIKRKQGEHHSEHEPSAKSSAIRYVCAKCGEPLPDGLSIDRCPKCGHTKYKEA